MLLKEGTAQADAALEGGGRGKSSICHHKQERRVCEGPVKAATRAIKCLGTTAAHPAHYCQTHGRARASSNSSHPTCDRGGGRAQHTHKNTHTWSVSQAMASALPVTIQARTYFHAAWTSKKDEIVLVWPSSMPTHRQAGPWRTPCSLRPQCTKNACTNEYICRRKFT
jgi:hypothetical protein